MECSIHNGIKVSTFYPKKQKKRQQFCKKISKHQQNQPSQKHKKKQPHNNNQPRTARNTNKISQTTKQTTSKIKKYKTFMDYRQAGRPHKPPQPKKGKTTALQ